VKGGIFKMRGLLKDKKGQFGNASNIVLGVVVFMVLIGVAYLIGDTFLTSLTPGSSSYNQTNEVFESLGTVVNFIPIIVIVAVAGIVLYLISRFGGGSRV
jgi:hypothetical protein